MKILILFAYATIFTITSANFVSAQQNGSEERDDEKEYKLPAGLVCESDDGELKGVLIQHSKPEIENEKDFGKERAEAMVETMILMGNLLPEWGIYDKALDEGGKLIAIGYNVSKGPQAILFRPVWAGNFPMKYEIIESRSYKIDPAALKVAPPTLKLLKVDNEEK